MKKIIAAIMVVITVMALSACGKKCDICGESGAKKYELMGQKIYVCDDCKSGNFLR